MNVTCRLTRFYQYALWSVVILLGLELMSYLVNEIPQRFFNPSAIPIRSETLDLTEGL